MSEIAQNFQRTVARLSPELLIGLGLACTIIGLFVWLGGLGFRKALVVAVGAAAGAICAFSIKGQDIIPLLLAVAAGIAMAIIFEKVFLTILAAALAAAFAFAVVAELSEAESHELRPGFGRQSFSPVLDCAPEGQPGFEMHFVDPVQAHRPDDFVPFLQTENGYVGLLFLGSLPECLDPYGSHFDTCGPGQQIGLD